MDRRPKRQCVSRKGALPSAAHYVGYVEDQETPEMIMRKFEELDKVMAGANQQKRTKPGPSSSHAAASAVGNQDPSLGAGPSNAATQHEASTGMSQPLTDQAPTTHAQGAGSPQTALQDPAGSPAAADTSDEPLDESLLLQVFRQTSIFNVRSALANNSVLLAAKGGSKDDPSRAGQLLHPVYEEETDPWSGEEEATSDAAGDLEYLRGVWSDEDMFEPGKAKGKASKKTTARGRRAGSVGPRDKEPSMWKVLGIAARERNIRNQVVMQYNRDTHALIRRKVRLPNGRDDIIQVRVPGPPLPTSWGRTVQPYDPSAPPIRLAVPCAPILLLPPAATPLASTVGHPVKSDNTYTHHPAAMSCDTTASTIHPGTSTRQLTMPPASSGGPLAPTPFHASQQLPAGPAAQQGVDMHSAPPPSGGLSPATEQRLTFGWKQAGLRQGSVPGGLSSAIDQLGGDGEPQYAARPQPAWVLAPPPPPLTALAPPPPPLAAPRRQASPCALTETGLHQEGGTEGQPAEEAGPQGPGCVAYFEVPDLAMCDLIGRLGRKRIFTVVLINYGWEVPGADGDDAKLVSRLRKLPVPTLCPGGFIFIWAQKTHIHAVCKQLYAWGYTYVENLSWVWVHASNAILRLPGTYLGRSHLTLIIFRKEGEGKDIQLRHQRNSDVIFDCLRDAQATCAPPSELYHIIQTMLPEEVAGGRCLELWAPQHVRRNGWVHAVQQQQDAKT